MTETQRVTSRSPGGSISPESERLLVSPTIHGEAKLTTPNEHVPPADFTPIPTYDEVDDNSSDSDDDEALFDASIDSNRPDGWLIGTYSSLKKLVAHAKGAASKPVVHFVKKYLRGTKLIFVLGQSGTGKSTLLSEISGQQLVIGKSHKSGTKNYQICPAIIDGEQYLFVDTAGFGAADINDMDNFHDIVTCLDALTPFITVAGVLFVYGGNQGRMMGADLTTIQWVKCFCGPDFYNRITIVTTKWDSLVDDDFEDAWNIKLPDLLDDSQIKDILEPAPVGSRRYHGGHVYHHGLKLAKDSDLSMPIERFSFRRRSAERAELARAMISKRYKGIPSMKLQVVREMANKTPCS
ncbi:hypothetical protein G7Z17_g1039 [Cylindrodendrum hubeiense]|uniref:AIG1-type G domain-containing protein n=1 Tax=Cylindrodendrum hubeiense TaxID=595255 RepID=A0A9P5HNM2_9HYPO|nr:hypothetical protein G7Z17_g1039 [Cylindrodendrum hubeiense]